MWSQVPLVVFGIIALLGIIALRRYYAGESAKLNRESHRWWWERRKKDRDDLLETARRIVAQGGFRPPRFDESSWTYAKTFDRWLSQQLKMQPTAQWSRPYEQTSKPTPPLRYPRLPRLPRVSRILRGTSAPRSWSLTTWTSVQFYWWATEHNGLVHRAAMLKHDHGETFTLRCDCEIWLEPAMVVQFPVGAGPMLTCIRCFGMPT